MNEKFLKVLNIVNNKLNPPKEKKVIDINGLVEGVNIKKLTPSFTNLRGINIEKICACNIYNPQKNKKLNEFLLPISKVKGFFIFKNKLYGFSDYLIFEIDFCSLKIKTILYKSNFLIKSIVAYNKKIIFTGADSFFKDNKMFILNENFEKENEIDFGFNIEALITFNGVLILGSKRKIFILNENFEKENEINIDFDISFFSEFKKKLIVIGQSSSRGQIIILNEGFEKEKEISFNEQLSCAIEYNGNLIVFGSSLTEDKLKLFIYDKSYNLIKNSCIIDSFVYSAIEFQKFLIINNEYNGIIKILNKDFECVNQCTNKKSVSSLLEFDNNLIVGFFDDFFTLNETNEYIEILDNDFEKKIGLRLEYGVSFLGSFLDFLLIKNNVAFGENNGMKIYIEIFDKSFHKIDTLVLNQIKSSKVSLVEYNKKLIIGVDNKVLEFNSELKKEMEYALNLQVKTEFFVENIFVMKKKLIIVCKLFKDPHEKYKISVFDTNFKKEKEFDINFRIDSITSFEENIIVSSYNKIIILNTNFEKINEIEIDFKIETLTKYKENIIIGGERKILVLNKNFEKEMEVYFFDNCIEKIDFVNNKIEIVSYSDDNLQVFYDYGKVLSEDGEVVAYYELDKKYWEIKDNVLTIKKDK